MKAYQEIDNKVEKLIIVLDRDIEHLQKTLIALNELRGAFIKRDEKSLGKLLDEVKTMSQEHALNESRRLLLQQELANLMECLPKQMTLSFMERVLLGEKKEQIHSRKMTLLSLLGRLKKEYKSTVLLLSEISRLNEMLLKSIFGQKHDVLTYNSSGSIGKKQATTFMNLQF